MPFDFMYLLSSDESNSLDEDYDKLGYDSRSYGTHSFTAFYLRFDYSVGSVSVLGYGVFAPTGVESKGGMFAFDVFV